MNEYYVAHYLDFRESEYERRLESLRSRATDLGAEWVLVTSDVNVRYFSGLKSVLFATKFQPIAALLPLRTDREPVLVVPEVLEGTCKATSWIESLRTSSECYGKPFSGVMPALVAALKEQGAVAGRLGVELGRLQRLGMTGTEVSVLREELPKLELVDAAELIWGARQTKSPLEIDAMATACEISASGVLAALEVVRPGVSEREVYTAIVAAYYRDGADGHLLNIQSGAKGSHVRDAAISDFKLERGHFLKLDGGATYKGYYCDYCRMIAVGPLLKPQVEAIDTSARANAVAMETARPGVAVAEVARAADRVVEEAGFGRYWNSVGHGLGLDLYEPPMLFRDSEEQIEAGQALSIEVGVVNPARWNDGSYTFEENMVVTEEGCRWLTDRIPPTLLVARG